MSKLDHLPLSAETSLELVGPCFTESDLAEVWGIGAAAVRGLARDQAIFSFSEDEQLHIPRKQFFMGEDGTPETATFLTDLVAVMRKHEPEDIKRLYFLALCMPRPELDDKNYIEAVNNITFREAQRLRISAAGILRSIRRAAAA